MPPRHMKSSLISVLWPAWEWSFAPWTRWLFASYDAGLSLRDAVNTRAVLSSPWFQDRFPGQVVFTGDQNVKSFFQNTARGHRISTSVDGAGTGHGGNRIVADDPHKVKGAESEADRENVKRWWKETMSTRGNDPRSTVRVIVQQRVHQDDLTNLAIEEGGWHHLCLPAEFEGPKYHLIEGSLVQDTSKDAPHPHIECRIHPDERRKEGELLWDPPYGPAQMQALKRDLGPFGTASQLQQRPTPRAGMLFREEILKPLPPNFDTPGPVEASLRRRLLYFTFFDLAFSTKESADLTAGVTLGIDPYEQMYITDVLVTRAQEYDDPDLDKSHGLAHALAMYLLDVRPHFVGIWQGAFRGLATQDLVRRVWEILQLHGAAIGLMAVRETLDKWTRALLPYNRATAGYLYVDRQAPWYPDYLAELTAFNKGKHDDQVDATSGAVALALLLGTQMRTQVAQFTHGEVLDLGAIFTGGTNAGPLG